VIIYAKGLPAYRTSKQYLDLRDGYYIKLSFSISHIYLFLHVYSMFFCAQNAFGSMASLCWMWMVSNNYSETVKLWRKAAN